MNQCESTHHILALCLYLVLSEMTEYWLGKTKRVDASSKLEILIIGAGMVVGAMICAYNRLFKKGK
jgi:hypothetical protein